MMLPGDEQELIEVALRNLRTMPLVPGRAQRDAIARLQPLLARALSALDGLERSRILSIKERQQRESLRVLRRALEELE